MQEPVVDLSECILCGICVDLVPEVFRLSQAGYVEVILLEEYPRALVDEAVRNCPVRCISWQPR